MTKRKELEVFQMEHLLPPDEARLLVDLAKDQTIGLLDTLEKIVTGQAWIGCGYASLGDLWQTEFAGIPVPKALRHQLVLELQSEGRSYRSITAVTGLSLGTIHRELNPASEVMSVDEAEKHLKNIDKWVKEGMSVLDSLDRVSRFPAKTFTFQQWLELQNAATRIGEKFAGFTGLFDEKTMEVRERAIAHMEFVPGCPDSKEVGALLDDAFGHLCFEDEDGTPRCHLMLRAELQVAELLITRHLQALTDEAGEKAQQGACHVRSAAEGNFASLEEYAEAVGEPYEEVFENVKKGIAYGILECEYTDGETVAVVIPDPDTLRKRGVNLTMGEYHNYIEWHAG